MALPVATPSRTFTIGGARGNAVRFNGDIDRTVRTSDLIGNADSQVGTISFWFRTAGGVTSLDYIYFSGPIGVVSTNRIFVTSDGIVRITCQNSSDDLILGLESDTQGYNDNKWHHCAASWNMSVFEEAHMYIDDVEDLHFLTFTQGETIDYTEPNHTIGSSTLGASDWNGDLADLYMNFAEFVDLSDASERAKFYDGGWVSLGSDGSTPTGTSPIMFFSGVLATWPDNAGTGGTFTENNAVTDAAPAGLMPSAVFTPQVLVDTIVASTSKLFNLTGNVPTIDAERLRVPIKSFTLAAQVPVAVSGVGIESPVKNFSLSPFIPSVSIGIDLGVPLYEFTLTGQTPAAGSSTTVVAPIGSFSLTGLTQRVGTSVDANAPLQTFTLTGQTISVGTAALIDVGVGSFTITGQEVNIQVDTLLNLSTFNFTFNGILPIVATGVAVEVSTGTFTIAGQLPTVPISINSPLQAFNLSESIVPSVRAWAEVDDSQSTTWIEV